MPDLALRVLRQFEWERPESSILQAVVVMVDAAFLLCVARQRGYFLLFQRCVQEESCSVETDVLSGKHALSYLE